METKPLGIEIRHLHHAVKRFIDIEMQPIIPTLSGTEGMMLRAISREEGGTTTAGHIMEISRVNKSSTSQMLSQLKRKGFIDVKADVSDHRKKIVSLTDSGWKAVEAMRAVLVSCEAKMATGLSEEELLAFRSTLNKIRENCHKEENQ